MYSKEVGKFYSWDFPKPGFLEKDEISDGRDKS
jgi:hypothetical protein